MDVDNHFSNLLEQIDTSSQTYTDPWLEAFIQDLEQKVTLEQKSLVDTLTVLSQAQMFRETTIYWTNRTKEKIEELSETLFSDTYSRIMRDLKTQYALDFKSGPYLLAAFTEDHIEDVRLFISDLIQSLECPLPQAQVDQLHENVNRYLIATTSERICELKNNYIHFKRLFYRHAHNNKLSEDARLKIDLIHKMIHFFATGEILPLSKDYHHLVEKGPLSICQLETFKNGNGTLTFPDSQTAYKFFIYFKLDQ